MPILNDERPWAWMSGKEKGTSERRPVEGGQGKAGGVFLCLRPSPRPKHQDLIVPGQARTCSSSLSVYANWGLILRQRQRSATSTCTR